MEYLHLQVLMSSSVQPTAFKIKDVWIDRSLAQLKYFLIVDPQGSAHPLPAAFVRYRSREHVTEVACQVDKLKTLETVSVPEKLTPEIEARLWAALGAKAPTSDEDGVMVNYTTGQKSLDHDSSCRGSLSVLGKTVETSTGRLGRTVDIVLDSSTWSVRYILVEDEMLKGRHVLVDPEWIESVHETTGEIFVGLSREILLLEAVFDQKSEGSRRYHIDV